MLHVLGTDLSFFITDPRNGRSGKIKCVTLKIDDAPVELQRAYSSIRVHAPSFVGFCADASNLIPDKEHRLAVELPKLAPGQFQGVFFDNVETEFTDVLAAAQ